jgi:hypothetical protein
MQNVHHTDQTLNHKLSRRLLSHKRGPWPSVCSHIVNTNSQSGTVQDSYPALSCPVKSYLTALPAPATPPNCFLFCTRTPSTSHSDFRFSLRVSLFAHRFSCSVPNSFIYRFYAESLSKSFIYRFYENHPGCTPSKERKNERQAIQYHHPTRNHGISPLATSHPKRPFPACRQASSENSANPATLSTFKMNTCKSVSKQRTLSPFRMNTYAKTGGRGSLVISTAAPNDVSVVAPPYCRSINGAPSYNMDTRIGEGI